MLRSVSATGRLLAAAVLITILAIGAMFGAALLVPASGHGVAAAPSGVRLATAVHPGAATITLNFTNTLPSPATVPVTLDYTLNYSALTSTQSVAVAITFIANGTTFETNAGPTALGANTITLNYGALAGEAALPETNWNFTAVASITDTSATSNPVASSTAWLLAPTASVLNPTVAITSNIPVYATLPITVNFTVGIAGNSGVTPSAANETVGVNFEYQQGTCLVIDPFTGACDLWQPVVVLNQSVTYSASGSYNFTFTSGMLTIASFSSGVLPTGIYQVDAWANVMSSTNASLQSRQVSSIGTFRFSANTPSGTIISPSNRTTGLVAGTNITVAVSYSSDYLAGANLYFIDEATKQITYTAGVFAPGNGGHGAVANWVPGNAGVYTIQLSLSFIDNYTAPYTYNETNVTISAGAPAGGNTAYVNTTNWVNASFIPGVSPAVGGALLLVIGLIVGMIVAAVLGRMMWNRPASQPAQAWSSSKSTTTTPTTGTSECSVCHQTFPTSAELVEHQKSAHGM